MHQRREVSILKRVQQVKVGRIGTRSLFGWTQPHAARLEKRLQDQDSRHPVYGLGPLLDADFGFAEDSVGFGGGEPLVPKVHGKPESAFQLRPERVDLLRLAALFTAHAQGIAKHDLAHLILSEQPLQTGKVAALVPALQRLNPLRRDAQRVGNGQAHPAGAVIDCQNAPQAFHPDIICSGRILSRVAANRIIPPPPEQLDANEAEDRTQASELQHQQRSERDFTRTVLAGSGAQVIIAMAVVLAICYVAKLVLVTLLVSVLIAFTLAPLVGILEKIRLPRAAAALIAVLLLTGACWGASYFFYNRAVDFAHELPKYSERVKGMLAHVRQQTADLQKSTETILPEAAKNAKRAVPVKVENSSGTEIITNHLGTLTEVALTLAFIPFLVYFMLSWQEHARRKTVELFRPEHRTVAYVTLGQIALMMRSFIAGNFIIGVFLSAASIAVFGVLGLQYFYFLGILSGFLSLMPYLGVILALVPPLAAGAGKLHEGGAIAILVTVVGLHLFAMNVLYPKVLGKRLQLNPLVVTIALLIWGWIWGAAGLVLAVPIMGVIKIICDHVTSLRAFGEWMGE
jgi:predicted PurR-regulated permease PerM